MTFLIMGPGSFPLMTLHGGACHSLIHQIAISNSPLPQIALSLCCRKVRIQCFSSPEFTLSPSAKSSTMLLLFVSQCSSACVQETVNLILKLYESCWIHIDPNVDDVVLIHGITDVDCMLARFRADRHISTVHSQNPRLHHGLRLDILPRF
jgi:hypothetical protein